MNVKHAIIFLLSGIFLNSTAQDIIPGTTYWDQDYENPDYCNYVTDITGVLYYGQNINNDISRENHLLVFSSPSVLAEDGCPSWISFTGLEDEINHCVFIKSEGGGINMSDNPYFSIKAKADRNDAILTAYVAYVGSDPAADFYPVSSTRYTGSGTIKIELTLTTTLQTYTFNFTNLPDDYTVWSAWTDRTQVNAYGVTPQTPDTKYYISRVTIGSHINTNIKSIPASSVSRVNSTDPCKDVTAVYASADNALNISTEAGGHVLIDASFHTDKVVVSDMAGRTEEFSSNEFYTTLKGVLILNCVSGDKVKKVKVMME